ncbi:MAG: hypothetical protein AAGE52_36720 [Myxococcota bacterium]
MRLLVLVALVGLVALVACSSDESASSCATAADCAGDRCVNGMCVPRDAGSLADRALDTSLDTSVDVGADAAVDSALADAAAADSAVADAGFDAPPVPLVDPFGARFDDAFPVFAAGRGSGSTFVFGRDRSPAQQALAAAFEGEDIAWALSLGGPSNDQFLAGAADRELALGAGITRNPTFGGDDVLVAFFDRTGLVSAAHLGDDARDIAFDADLRGRTAFLAGQNGARPGIWITDFDDAFAAVLQTPEPATFRGVAASETAVYAVGQDDDPGSAYIAAFRADDASPLWARSLRIDEDPLALVDVAVDDSVVAVGVAGARGVRLEFSLDGELRAAGFTTIGQFRQVELIEGRSRYIGVVGGRAAVFADAGGGRLVGYRTSVRGPGTAGRHLDDGVFVANNTGESVDLTRVVLLTINADDRPSCEVDEELTGFFEAVPVSREPVGAERVTTSVETFALSSSEVESAPLAACP